MNRATAAARSLFVCWLAALAACNLVWQSDDYAFVDAPPGPTVSCAVDGDCSGSSACSTARCDSGSCVLDHVPADTPLPESSQTGGDCRVAVCDGLGQESSLADDADVGDDDLECTTDGCDDGAPSHVPVAVGTPCNQDGGVVCNPAGLCVAAGCANQVLDGAETDVDCGGGECPGCGTGDVCMMGSDCVDKVCLEMQCAPPSCDDGVKNGVETGTDCGGGCPGCPGGSACGLAADCDSGVCTNLLCQYANCIDGILNGSETGSDCGGFCPGCNDGAFCIADDDCLSLKCTGGICQPATCLDNVRNATETDVDCGGSCPDCPNGDRCSTGTDCQSTHCSYGKCVPPACVNAAQDGAETDIDCGGPFCAACPNGAACNDALDCQSGVCAGLACAAPTCFDTVHNGAETDADCGGPCNACPVGQGCITDSDCNTDVCIYSQCALVNGCNPATAQDLTGMAQVFITFGMMTFNPKCIRVSAGTDLVLQGNFGVHPIWPGKVVLAVEFPEPTSPVQPTTMGTRATFTLTDPGIVPYYCDKHAGGGMAGAAFVE
jgi:plastocyanin